MSLSPNRTNKITSSRVLELHAVAIQLWGGDPSAADVGCVSKCINGAYTSAMYNATVDSNVFKEPDMLVFSAYLFMYLVKNHCFTDGNKRVAWMALVDQLAMLKVTIAASQEEVVEFVLCVEKQQSPSVEQVIDWLACRLTTDGGRALAN